MKKIVILVLSLVSLLLFSSLASATSIVNGDFETGDLTGWSSTGGATIVIIGGSNAVKIPAGHEITQPFTWAVGDILTFDWAFEYIGTATSPSSADYGYFGVQKTGESRINSIFPYDLDGPDYWRNITHTFLTAGTGIIYFGVNNYQGDSDISNAYLDNIRILGDAMPIPEPATMLLLGTGLVGVAGAARRRNKKRT